MTTTTWFDRALDMIRFRAGEVIVAAGNVADRMYVVVAGEVEARDCDGATERYGCGSLLGEAAFLHGGQWTTTIVALAECTLAPINRRQYGIQASHHPRMNQRASIRHMRRSL